MGNVLLRGGIVRLRRIKIIKADGTVMKLRISPLSVKEILIDYPNHAIFQAPAGPRLGMSSFSQPLPERVELVAGNLYYLIPLPLPQDELIIYNSNRRPFAGASSYHGIPSESSKLQPESSAGIDRNSLKQEAADAAIDKINIRGSVMPVSSSYSTDGLTVRVKLRLRKKELASFLSANNVKHATRQSALLPWKPRLDTIAEPYSPLRDL